MAPKSHSLLYSSAFPIFVTLGNILKASPAAWPILCTRYTSLEHQQIWLAPVLRHLDFPVRPPPFTTWLLHSRSSLPGPAPSLPTRLPWHANSPCSSRSSPTLASRYDLPSSTLHAWRRSPALRLAGRAMRRCLDRSGRKIDAPEWSSLCCCLRLDKKEMRMVCVDWDGG